jgi:membrane-associated protease RseP (regulator of RpoE activity)
MNEVFRKSFVILVISVFLLSGCAKPTTQYTSAEPGQVSEEAKKQKVLALKKFYEYRERFYNIAYPILRKNKEFCGDNIKAEVGFRVISWSFFDEKEKEIRIEALDIGEGCQVSYVEPGSAVDDAGLKVNDKIISINNTLLTDTELTSEEFNAALGELNSENEVTITILRDETEQQIQFTPYDICFYSPVLLASDEVNAAADGHRIIFTYGMLRFAETDLDVATVFSHELAHNIMAHIEAQLHNAKIGLGVGAVFDIAAAIFGVNTQGSFMEMGAKAGSRYGSQDFEREADYVGLYILANAGYNVDAAPALWRRLAAEHPNSIEEGLLGSHPSSAERYASMEQTVQEINQKKIEGKPLKFQLKKTTSNESKTEVDGSDK